MYISLHGYNKNKNKIKAVDRRRQERNVIYTDPIVLVCNFLYIFNYNNDTVTKCKKLYRTSIKIRHKKTHKTELKTCHIKFAFRKR